MWSSIGADGHMLVEANEPGMGYTLELAVTDPPFVSDPGFEAWRASKYEISMSRTELTQLRNALTTALVGSEGELMPTMTVDVGSCARCGGDHLKLTFEQLHRPMRNTDQPEFTFWAACPGNGQPIMMGVHDTPDAKAKPE